MSSLTLNNTCVLYLKWLDFWGFCPLAIQGFCFGWQACLILLNIFNYVGVRNKESKLETLEYTDATGQTINLFNK